MNEHSDGVPSEILDLAEKPMSKGRLVVEGTWKRFFPMDEESLDARFLHAAFIQVESATFPLRAVEVDCEGHCLRLDF